MASRKSGRPRARTKSTMRQLTFVDSFASDVLEHHDMSCFSLGSASRGQKRSCRSESEGRSREHFQSVRSVPGPVVNARLTSTAAQWSRYACYSPFSGEEREGQRG